MHARKHDEAGDAIVKAARSVLSIAPALPVRDQIEGELAVADAARGRGYFLPDEDAQVRLLFARYLTVRSALHATLKELKPYVIRGPARLSGPLQLQAFAVVFCTGCLLIRSGRFMVDQFSKNSVVVRKLDEAAPEYGIPRKQFTTIFKSLTRPGNIIAFQEALRFYEDHRDELNKLRDHPDLGPIIALVASEAPLVEPDPAYYASKAVQYRIFSILRRQRSGINAVTFSLFRLSGRVISEIRNQWRRKRITPRVRKRIGELLQPGDVIITRHDDALSNHFLPGFWPHGAFYIGTADARRKLGVTMTADRWARSGEDTCVLEARKDGVLFRKLAETLAVDCCVVIRPRLGEQDRRDAVTRAVTHEGKLYDFEFDFSRADRLACTELIYRSLHDAGAIRLSLKERAGRFCLSAEDLLDQAVDQETFEVISVYGVGGNKLVQGERAREVLIGSYRLNSSLL
jgi:hypothetical protein